MDNKLYKAILSPAECAMDLGDGSERGEYVCQDYILNVLGRPHRAIGLMYTYYPKDKEWSDKKISVTCKDMEVSFQWDYPYDDYFPYRQNGQPFEQMRDIRRHGQDVFLTLTIDCSLEDGELRAIARELKPYGRLRLRINHECTGDWFTHNKRFTFEEIGAFYVRFAKIVKEEAPNVTTIFCAGMARNADGSVEREEEFTEAYRTADEWSADAYLALHFAWPFGVAEKGGDGFTCGNVDNNFELFKKTYERLTWLNGGVPKPMTTAEIDTDGDVSGAAAQGDSVRRFYEKIRDEKADWFKSASFYQFRDRGRLGLEIEDPNNSRIGIPQPIMREYRKILNDPYFMPKTELCGEISLPCQMRWGGAEDAEGVAIKIPFESTPVFCEITFDEPLCLMLELNGRWFYKSPSTKTIDLMPAFFDKPLESICELPLRIFATPPDGVNVDDGREDWAVNYYAEMTKLPELRVRFEPVGVVV